MYDVSHIAKWFLNRDRMTNMLGDSDGISGFKLQRLLYYAQGTFMALKNEMMFEDDFRAWKYGPIIESIYEDYIYYATFPIVFDENYSDADIDEDDRHLLEDIFDEYSCFSAWKLRDMVLSEDPWKLTKLGEIIDSALIKDYFVRAIISWDDMCDTKRG
jgi:uncharacterized phage-associated protein